MAAAQGLGLPSHLDVMTELWFWIICATGALLALIVLWAIVEMLLGTGADSAPNDPTLNAFQQPLRKKD